MMTEEERMGLKQSEAFFNFGSDGEELGEGFTLLEPHSLLLGHHGKLLVSILLPLISQPVPSKRL